VAAVSNLDLVSAVRAGGEVQERVFDYWAQRYARHFAKGEEGYKLYCAILEVVREFCAAEGVRAYQSRFVPLLDRSFLQDRFIEVLADAIGSELQVSPWWRKLWRVILLW
jgi:hypothetical protein